MVPAAGPRCKLAVIPWGAGGIDSLPPPPPWCRVPRSSTCGHSVNYRGGQSLHCEIHVGSPTRVGETVKWLAECSYFAWGWGDKTEYDQAYAPGEGVSHHHADSFVRHQPRWPGCIFLLTIMREQEAGAGGQVRFFVIPSHSRPAISGISTLNLRSIQEHALNFFNIPFFVPRRTHLGRCDASGLRS
jgi:hypothetical protein